MGATGELAREPGFQCRACSSDGATNRCPRPAHQRRAPWQADAADNVGRQRALEYGIDVGGAVRTQEVGAVRGRRRQEHRRRQDRLALDQRPQQLVFARRKAMSRRHRHRLDVGIVKAHGVAPLLLSPAHVPAMAAVINNSRIARHGLAFPLSIERKPAVTQAGKETGRQEAIGHRARIAAQR